MPNYYQGKSILITGGVGTIGSCLMNRLLLQKPKVIRIYDNNEYKLYELSLQKNPFIRPLLGDIRDYQRLKKAMEDVDIVFHAAALKHVELSEFNPFEVVKTNVLGTQNLLQAALDSNIEKVIVISTDKAANPVNTMGATKLLAEKLTVSASYHKGKIRTKFAVVRFGNVLGSNGSVVPLWKSQCLENQSLTITDKRMTRFIMSTDHAIELVLKAATVAQGGEIFILKMPAIRISDLATALISLMQAQNPTMSKKIKISEIGHKIGEKLHEELIVESELDDLYESDEMFVIMPRKELMGLKMVEQGHNFKKVTQHVQHSSNTNSFLSIEQIKKLLLESGAV